MSPSAASSAGRFLRREASFRVDWEELMPEERELLCIWEMRDRYIEAVPLRFARRG